MFPSSDEKLWQTATAERKRKKPFRISFEYDSVTDRNKYLEVERGDKIRGTLLKGKQPKKST